MYKNRLLFFVLLLTTSTVFAISDKQLIRTCFQKGAEKVSLQAQMWGCEVTVDKIRVQEIDNRWYNPSKYIWYQAITPCNGYDRIIQMVQYYKGHCL